MTSKRHHNKTSELARKHGTTLIGTLRTHYGPRFAVKDAPPNRPNSIPSNLAMKFAQPK